MDNNFINDEGFKELLESIESASKELPEADAVLDAIRRLGDAAEDEDIDSIISEINGILDDMDDKYGRVSFFDEEGNEYFYEILGSIQDDNTERYLVVTPDEIEEGDEATVYVLHVFDEDEDGNGCLEFVEDEETFNRVLEKYNETYNEGDEDE